MQLKNQYYWFKSIFTDDECKKITDLGLKTIEENKKNNVSVIGTTAGNTHKQALKDSIPLNDKNLDDLKKEKTFKEKKIYVRDSEIAWINEQWIYDKVFYYLKIANKNSGWNFDYDFAENFQFTTYYPGGFYGWHSDGGSDHLSKYKRYIPGISPENNEDKKKYVENPNWIGKVRKLSLTINLNEPEDYEGGNLKFDFGPHNENTRFYECTEIRPQGSMIVFPSFVYHQVTPITKGTRYSLVLWVLGEPFK